MVDNSKLVSSEVIKNSGVSFGTSGVRGLVTQLTPDVCSAFTIAFAMEMKRNFEFQSVVIAIDNRPSSQAIAQACAAVLNQLDIDVVYYGVVPTPALAYVAQEDSVPAIMVTGSHIPFDRNGIKFYRPDGEISKADELVIMTEQVEFTTPVELPYLPISNRAAEAYISRYTSLFDSPWLKGKRIGIYEHSSAGRDLYYRIFETLGAEVVALERSDKFVPIDTEAVSEEDTQKAINWSKKYKLDAVFSTDGDGDRPLVSDENGNWLRGDILGTLAAEALNIDALAVPVSCNTAIELSNKFKTVARTKIGSPYVIEEFAKLADEYNAVAGFEANGGFLLGSDIELNGQLLRALATRDAVLPVIMLLRAAEGKLISDLVGNLPKRFTYSDRLQDFSKEKSEELIAIGRASPDNLLRTLSVLDVHVLHVDETDGLRMTLSDSSIVHFRPSGNAPELRCYAEANSSELAKEYVTHCLDKALEVTIYTGG
ncbi:phosphomannomutase [Vibrio scophthalmi]|uniref:phosphomannomutase n=1 Tax=Vibrio scophthalmi TaxID=45658 RepID=UPI002283A9A5|nr:phosphomannomutase [Vibrio scophthalmi]MCY9804051.1 phosphomannomutase [Vibrio scophthalmi]